MRMFQFDVMQDLAPNAVESTQQATLKICGRDIRIKIVR